MISHVLRHRMLLLYRKENPYTHICKNTEGKNNLHGKIEGQEQICNDALSKVRTLRSKSFHEMNNMSSK